MAFKPPPIIHIDTTDNIFENADIFEIVPQDVYTSDDLNWTNPNSRVCREHDDESLRDVPLTSTAVDGWENYDTVYIGYPIWWFNAPMAIGSFLESYDLSGKTIVPFCTSQDNGIDVSMDYIRKNAKNAEVLEGHRIHNSDSAEIKTWLKEIGTIS